MAFNLKNNVFFISTETEELMSSGAETSKFFGKAWAGFPVPMIAYPSGFFR
jgi:hypothetical protein